VQAWPTSRPVREWHHAFRPHLDLHHDRHRGDLEREFRERRALEDVPLAVEFRREVPV